MLGDADVLFMWQRWGGRCSVCVCVLGFSVRSPFATLCNQIEFTELTNRCFSPSIFIYNMGRPGGDKASDIRCRASPRTRADTNRYRH